jgi:hypothetical protein
VLQYFACSGPLSISVLSIHFILPDIKKWPEVMISFLTPVTNFELDIVPPSLLPTLHLNLSIMVID